MKEELSCRYDTAKSFYGKANVEITDGEGFCNYSLISYSTMVGCAYYDKINRIVRYTYMGHFSATTTRHQKEFFRQHGLSDKEIKVLFKDGHILKGF